MKSRKYLVWVALAMALVVFTTGCSFNFSTAKIEEAIMTDMVDAEGKPGSTVTSYPANTAVLYTSAKILNAPDNTKIRIVWTYVTGNQLIDSIELDSGDISNRYIYSNLTPTSILPLGDYQVEYFIEDRKEPDATVKFTVEEAQELSNSSMTNDASSGVEYSVYSQKEGGFTFEYPSDWTLQEFPDDLSAWVYPAGASVEGEDDINTVYVFASKGDASSYTIDTLLQAWVDETENDNIENYEYIAQSVDTINGKDIASYSYSFTRGDYQLYTVDALLLDGANFYAMSFLTTADQYEALYPLFEHLAISFEVLK